MTKIVPNFMEHMILHIQEFNMYWEGNGKETLIETHSNKTPEDTDKLRILNLQERSE
jgi:hypothetical protein